MNKVIKRNHLLIFTLLLVTSLVQGQVTIGSAKAPASGALLDLKNKDNGYSDKGLGLPRVELKTLTPIVGELAESIGGVSANAPWDEKEHAGLVVYNVKDREIDQGETCPGLHVWDGTAWHPIAPYSAVETRKTPVGTPTKAAITLLGSYAAGGIINTSDPKWAELGKDPADYPIGATPSITMIDGDNNSYASQRFYVGYQTLNGTLQEEKNLSCNSTIPIWIAVGTPQPSTSEEFVDGVWITSNVYSTQKAGTGAFDKGGDLDNQVRLNAAYYSNGSGAISIAVGGLSSTTTVKYGETTDASASNTWNNTVSQKVYASKFGLSYTHNQATQVCPADWSLPDDYMWDALALAHGGANVAGAAMRSKPDENGFYYYRSTDNTEYRWGIPAESGVISLGFDAIPSGRVAASGTNALNFSTYIYWWSATTSSNARFINYGSSALNAATYGAGNYYAVRCVRN